RQSWALRRRAGAASRDARRLPADSVGRLPRGGADTVPAGARARRRVRPRPVRTALVVPLPAIRNGCAGKAGTTSYGRRRKRRLGAGFWPAITRRQGPPSPLARLSSLAAGECGLWLGARDPEARRHYWQGQEWRARSESWG